MINIAILGYGTVGSGVVEVLNTNKESIDRRCGKKIQIKKVLDLRDFPKDPIQDLITHDFETIINDDEIEVIVEVMGGIEPAYTFVKRALQKGKSVITSNKELVAKHGAELLKIAKSKNVNFLFEASVGGGIPIIRSINQSLTADEIIEITGILNGTTNYILTKMATEGLSFHDVLKIAQDKGYAERNPEADVEGYDACRKIAILSSLAFGKQVDFEDIYTEGITKISKIDFEYGKKMGKDLKLIATSKKLHDHVFARVTPLFLDNEHPLASVPGVFNAILVKGNMLGDAMFYGKGAGKLPTASAVVADIVDSVKHINNNTNIISFWSEEKQNLMSIKEVPCKFFIRLKNNNINNLVKNIKNMNFVNEVIQLEDNDKEIGILIDEIQEFMLTEIKNEIINIEGTDILNTIRVD